MRKIYKNKRGSAFVWLIVMFSIFTIGLIYMIMSQPIRVVQDATNSTLNDPDYAQSYNTTIMAWKYSPILLIIGLMIWGIISSLKKEPFSGGFGPLP